MPKIHNDNGRQWVTTYSIKTWHSLAEWQDVLNQMTAEGWRVDCHRPSGTADNGCTVFVSTEEIRTPLLDASIRCREIYHVVNSTEMYQLQQQPGNNAEAACKMICDRIKQVCSPGE